MAALILQGVLAQKSDCPQDIILSETEALATALKRVEPGGLVVIFPESVSGIIELIQAQGVVS